jgi:hypothetical protein
MVADLDAALDPPIDRHVLRADEIAPEHHRLADPGDDAAFLGLAGSGLVRRCGVLCLRHRLALRS